MNGTRPRLLRTSPITGVAFEEIEQFDWDAAHVITDVRHAAEHRLIAYGLIGDRLHTCVFTMRGERTRIVGVWKSRQPRDQAL